MGSLNLIVDLFGTLVPKWPSRLSTQTLRQMAASLGVDEVTFADAWQLRTCDWELGRITLEKSLSDVLAALGWPAETSKVNEPKGMWMDLVRKCIRPRNDDVLDTLRWCREHGIKVGLISNAGPDVP